MTTDVARARSASPRASVAAVPVAVAHPVVDLVSGGLRPATILAAHSAAVVLCCDDATGSDGPVRVVTVLTREASGVPNGVRTTFSAADRPFRHLNVGAAAFVGGGGIQLAGINLRAVRTIRAAVPHISASPAAVARIADAAAASPRGVADGPVDDLRRALADGDAAGLRAAVRALVGLGAGSTPGGDDVLSGTLAGLIATRRFVLAHQIAAAALHDLSARTTLMSADLLRLAAQGHVCTEAGAVLRAAAGAVRRAGGGGGGPDGGGRDAGGTDGRRKTAGTAGARRGAGGGEGGRGADGGPDAGDTDGRRETAGTAGAGRDAAPISRGTAGGASDRADALSMALRHLLAIGHTSGADLATGLALGLGVPDQPQPRLPRRSRGRAAAVPVP